MSKREKQRATSRFSQLELLGNISAGIHVMAGRASYMVFILQLE
jgi:hypothetical protein